jgi:threonine aldolase
MIDLRSDTVTRPSSAMRQAMAEAEVGDDVYGEDPTVNQLQDDIAGLLDTEAALFVPSGTMANQIALHVLTDPGDEVILDATSHIYNYETGAAGVLSGIQLHPVATPDGLLTPEAVETAIRPAGAVFARSRVLALENTANKAGGRVYSLERVRAVTEVARTHGLHTLLDGARLWNAAAATGISLADYAAPFDLVWVALSKGLGAPVGSVLAGNTDRIAMARRVRKRLGGGMRQAGILAAAGRYALAHHRGQLATDHAHAQRLAHALCELPAFRIDPATVETNIVIFDTVDAPAETVANRLAEEEIGVTPFGPHTLRATTHRDVSSNDIDVVVDTLHALYGSM